MDQNLGKLQSLMHKNFFDRAQAAVDSGYFLEAIFLEYAAIEGRLEVILGILGLPCNKDLEPGIRKDIKISARIQCLNKFLKQCPSVFEKTKLEANFFSDKGHLRKWIQKRNTYVHGLYKNAQDYENRNDMCKDLAENGLALARSLYNEANRVRRLSKSHPDLLAMECRICQSKTCSASAIKKD